MAILLDINFNKIKIQLVYSVFYNVQQSSYLNNPNAIQIQLETCV